NFHWHRQLSFPWVGIVSSIGSVFVTSGVGSSYLQNLLDLSFTLIPLHYALFALGIVLFTLSFPQSAEPLTSLPRYTMILFPVTAIFALWGKREHFHWVVVVFSLSLLALNIVLFIGHYWVA